MSEWTEGPWEFVPGNEHHGPYVSAPYGGDICDCYTMSNPNLPSVRNGGLSRPIWFHAERANANARLIAAAPELFDLVFRRAQWDDDSPWRREARALIERINGAADAS